MCRRGTCSLATLAVAGRQRNWIQYPQLDTVSATERAPTRGRLLRQGEDYGESLLHFEMLVHISHSCACEVEYTFNAIYDLHTMDLSQVAG
jgi:hypothetical protein